MSHYIERPRFSCALGGALETIGSLPGVVPIIHAASGCGGNLFSSSQAGGYYGSGYCGGLSAPSSNVSEKEIIFGGEERLIEQIESTLALIDAELFVVVTGCMTGIIGDDPKAAVAKVKSKTPILVTDTAGFRGNSYKGYDYVLQTLFADYVRKSAEKEPKTVNLFGIVPAHDPFFRGDLGEIKRLLGKLDIKANTFFGFGETMKNLKDAGKASLNIVFSRVYGTEAAETFKEVHDTPYIIRDLPIGPSATEEFLFDIVRQLGIDEKLAAKVIDEEKQHFYWYIERVSDSYLDAELQNYAIIVADSNYAYPFTRFLSDDIGWIPKLTVITDYLNDEQKERLSGLFDKDFESVAAPRLVFETDTSQIQFRYTDSIRLYSGDRYFTVPSPLFVMGSSQDFDWARDLNAKALSVSYPITDRAILSKHYAGFSGGLNLFEDILDVILKGGK